MGTELDLLPRCRIVAPSGAVSIRRSGRSLFDIRLVVVEGDVLPAVRVHGNARITGSPSRFNEELHWPGAGRRPTRGRGNRPGSIAAGAASRTGTGAAARGRGRVGAGGLPVPASVGVPVPVPASVGVPVPVPVGVPPLALGMPSLSPPPPQAASPAAKAAQVTMAPSRRRISFETRVDMETSFRSWVDRGAGWCFSPSLPASVVRRSGGPTDGPSAGGRMGHAMGHALDIRAPLHCFSDFA
jgi:hypothetical protein